MAKKKKSFFLKRWMTGLTNVLDRWIFKFTPEKGETYGKIFWWITVVGFVGGIILAISSFGNKGHNEHGLYGIHSICAVVAAVLAIWYGIKNIPLIEGGVGTKIFRGVYILIWGAIGFLLGMVAGLFVVFAVIMLVVLYIFLHMVFNVDLGGGGSKRSNNNDNNDNDDDDRVKLDNGTTIEKDATGRWHNTNNWSDTYTENGGGSFTQDN